MYKICKNFEDFQKCIWKIYNKLSMHLSEFTIAEGGGASATSCRGLELLEMTRHFVYRIFLNLFIYVGLGQAREGFLCRHEQSLSLLANIAYFSSYIRLVVYKHLSSVCMIVYIFMNAVNYYLPKPGSRFWCLR